MPDVKPAWYCDDPLFNRFAQSLGLVPRSCAELEGAPGAEDALVIDMRLLELLKAGLVVPVDRLLADIDRKLLRPLLASFDRGQLQIVLRAGYELDFKLKPSDRMKFWRRNRNLVSWTNARDEYR